MTYLYNWCSKCGKPKDIGDSTVPVDICNCPPDWAPMKLTGWTCPKCGAGISPFTDQCPNCRPPTTITFSGLGNSLG